MPLRLSGRGLRLAMWLTLVVTVLSLTTTSLTRAKQPAWLSQPTWGNLRIFLPPLT